MSETMEVWPLFCCIVAVLADNPFSDSGSDCSWIKCYNSGTIVFQDQQCVCHCAPGYSGILCEYEINQSSWPDGPYALLMPSTGCPEDETYGWSPGYINMTTVDPIEIWVSTNGSTSSVTLSEANTKLAGPFGNYNIQLNFCFKHANWSTIEDTVWPTASVDVFGDFDVCPEGMTEKMQIMILPAIRFWWSDGHLPYFEVHEYSNVTELWFKRCISNVTNHTLDTSIDTPFILMKDFDVNCPSDEYIQIKEETLVFIHNGENNKTYTNISVCIFSPVKKPDPMEELCKHLIQMEVLYPPCMEKDKDNETVHVITNCQKPLGLTDGTIEDYQITASSWDKSNAPHMARFADIGWCPAVDDASPYLQIDLFTISLVGGLTLFHRVNFIDTLENNFYSRRLVPEGCRSFMISYGVFPGGSKNYNERPFVIDDSQVFEQPQSFTFLRPFLARYIKLYPKEPVRGGRLCMRVELHGCSSTAKLTPTCDKDSETFWTPLLSTTPSSALSVGSTATSLTDCQNDCEQLIGKCKAIQYIANETCSLYSSPFPSAVTSPREVSHTSSSLLVCQVELSVPEYISLQANNTVDMSVVLLDTEVLHSIGYPMYYKSNTTFKWTVTSAHGGFIRLTFAVIDFYNHSMISSNGCLEDKLVFDDYFQPITSFQNGLTPTFPTNKNSLVIVFHTCVRNHRRSDRRQGFKVIMAAEDLPTVWRDDMVLSRMQQGYIMSYTLLGVIGNRLDSQRWVIRSRLSGGPFILTFWHFNIPCLDGSYLSIWDGGRSTDKLCNSQQKPISEYKSWYFIINFQYLKDNPDLREQVGFGALFQVEPLLKLPPWITPNDLADGDSQVTGRNTEVYTVCSKTLNKCYRYKRHGYEDFIDWSTHAQFCHNLGFHHPVIHNSKEMEFLQAFLLFKELEQMDLVGSSPPYQIHTHIGLVRYQNSEGLQQIWQDGTSVTYTAWGDGEPNNAFQDLCTGMNTDVTTGEGSWFTDTCAQLKPHGVLVSVCEKSYAILNTSGLTDYTRNEGNETVASKVEPEYKDLLFQCNSTEWVAYIAVCDGISDCFDGSDELYCEKHRSGGKCLTDEFACNSDVCIHVGHVCDFIQDCPDGSDEYCKFPECKDGEYKCDNNQCVPEYTRCDAVDDCYDGSDERLCESCNSTIAFSCGDLNCIPKSLVCNRVPDCGDGRDEIACTKTYKTCYDYWQDGYNSNLTMKEIVGTQTIGHFLYCRFYWIDTNVLGIRSLLDWAMLWSAMTSNYAFGSVSAETFKDHGQTCTFEVTERCKYHLNEIASYVDPSYNGSYSFCRPRSVQYITDGNRFWKGDSDGTLLGMIIDVEGNSVTFQQLRSVHIDFQTSVLANLSTEIKPVVCLAEYPQRDINCGDGMTVRGDCKCLYDFTRGGVIDGCRNFKHLDTCENFLCPFGFTKCPSSFCLAQRFVCDGERQCPGGEDEKNCLSTGDNYTLAVVYSRETSDYIKSIIFKFARQFYSTNINLYAISYHGNNDIIGVNIRKVHPYSEVLNMAETTSFERESTSVVSKIISHLKENASSIKIINIELERFSKQSFTEHFSNISANDYTYHILVDNRMQKQVAVSHNAIGTHITVKRIAILASIGPTLIYLRGKEASAPNTSGLFKCLSSQIRIPANQTCDGRTQCPFGDDETMCDFQCLQTCSCEPYITDCHSKDLKDIYLVDFDSNTRVIDISNTTVFREGRLLIPKPFPYLIKLYVKQCQLISIEDMTFTNATSLIELDLSFNDIRVLRESTFAGLKYIKVLNLNGNRFLSKIEPNTFRMLSYLKDISITQSLISEIMPSTFSGLILSTLDISNNEIRTLHAYAFKDLTVGEINFEGNEITTFDEKLFSGVQNLTTIRSPSFKFCCFKPSSVQDDNCWPHGDEFSSCKDLMKNSILQTLLWMIGAAALVANGITIMYRLINGRQKIKKGFGMFVLNLAASDFLMGVYLIIIATADITFRNRYILEDENWRKSIWCNIAGILATVSSEASVGFMCLISVERFLVIKFPFGQWRFSARASRVAVIINWSISLIIALLPIMVHDYFQNSFYSTSGVCLAMPLTRRRPPGWLYSFIIYVAVNFAAFILIAIGQLVIYLEIRKSSKQMEQYRSARSNDISIARNLFLVFITDFLCWFPIGVMAIMAYDGYSIPGDVYAWTAVLILPVNSALNPFLYTLSAVVGLKKKSKNRANTYETTKETAT